MSAQKKLGEILVAAGVIDQFQLRSALGEQQRWGGRLGITLIKLGFLDERDLVRALAGQLHLPVARLEGKRIQKEVLDLVPVDVAERAMCLPLFIREEAGKRTLYLGMEDPCDLQVMDDLRFRTGLMLKPVLMGPSEICEGIDRFYHRRDTQTDELELIESPAPAAIARSHRDPEDRQDAPADEVGVSTSLPTAAAAAPPLSAVPEAPTLPTPESSPGVWVAAVLDILVEKGVATRSELEAHVVRQLGLAPNDSDAS